jgi:hypothetical protein
MTTWKCGACGRENDCEQEICLCGEAHRDEKPIEHKQRDGVGVDMTWAVGIALVVCVLAAIALAN